MLLLLLQFRVHIVAITYYFKNIIEIYCSWISFCSVYFFEQHASNGTEITSTVQKISHFLDSNQGKIPSHAGFSWVVCGMAWPHIVGWFYCCFARGRRLLVRQSLCIRNRQCTLLHFNLAVCVYTHTHKV